MQQELIHTVQTLLGCKSLEDVPKEQLEGMVLEYPYSALIQLLHAKKLQTLHDPGYSEAVSRTALYFSNPHWLNFQLWNRDGKDLWEETETDHTAGTVETVASSAGVSEATEPTTANHPPMLRPWQEPVIRAIDAESEARHPEMLPFDTQETNHAVFHEPVEILGTENQNPAGEDSAPAKMPGDVPPLLPVEVSASPESEPDHAAEPVPLHAGPEIPSLVPIEPYYTIDYFASQGIQLTEAESQDNLGRKLKSFTDWLKTMKKVHPDRRVQPIDQFAEERIKEGAELSNDQHEVLTEAMAEVFLKQGLKHKAIEVYRKLSLLNPHLSATFAAKIADLND